MNGKPILIGALIASLPLGAGAQTGQAGAPGAPPAEQSTPAPPAPAAEEPGKLILEGDLRIRTEVWDWFDPGRGLQDDYTFTHARLRARLGYKEPNFETLFELQDVQALGLPTRAIGPGAIGQMGPGATVFSHAGASDVNTMGLRQAYIRAGAADTFQAQIGRFEYNTGVEVMPKDPALATLKRTRLASRLIGTFDFSPYARTFDGIRLDGDTEDFHVTALVARPTHGGFEPRFGVGMDSVLVSNLALTARMEEGEAQGFWIHYGDDRPVPQVDNRPIPLRGTIQGTGGNQLETLGFHFLHKIGDNGDALVWYAHQTGRWGNQTHRADAFSAELGYQFKEADWQPWLRAGYSYYSGDSNPNDGVHGSFYPILPTIRLYALTPFYSESNLKDAFAQLIVKPGEQTTARLEAHFLRLAQPNDLWYVGAGATRSAGTIQGMAGRPGGGATGLGTLVDIGIDHQFDAMNKLSLYYGHVFGGDVIRSAFPVNPNGNFFYLEYNLKFP